MKVKWSKKYVSIGITAFLVIAAGSLLLLFLMKFDAAWGAFLKILSILMPIILGAGFAFLMNPILNFFEKACFARLFRKRIEKRGNSRLPRIFGLIATLLVVLLGLGGLIGIIIPQLVTSVSGLVEKAPLYLDNMKSGLNSLIASSPWLADFLGNDADALILRVQEALEKAAPTLQSSIASITGFVIGGAIGVVNAVTDVILGVFVSVYVLYSKERFAAQAKKVVYAIFNRRHAERLLDETRNANRVYSGFISGKLLDSLIIGILTFVVLSVVQMPYAVLISVIIGVTNVIPYFGPFIGAIPCILFLLLVDPLKAVLFAVIILIIQQLDGNLIGPKILGDSTGLSAFWVIFAILVGGGLFGFIGMLLGVPTWAVIYSLIRVFIHDRLRKKQLPVETEAYLDGQLPPPAEVSPDMPVSE